MHNNYETQYLNLLNKVLTTGKLSSNRTGIDTLKIWGAQMHIDLTQGFPLVTTKKMHWKSVVHELLWMIKGDTNIQYLLKNGVTFWTEWPYAQYKNWFETKCGNISIYGKRDAGCRSARVYTQKEFEQEIINNDEFAEKWGSIGQFGYGGLWRKFPVKNYYSQEDLLKYSVVGDAVGADENANYLQFVDQVSNVINDLKTNPDSRRIIISAWHPYHSNRQEDALLPACHNYIQFGTEELTFIERINESFRDPKYRQQEPSWGQVGYISEQERIDFLNRMNVPTKRLNCYYSMRSNDLFLGNPYNNVFYALFTHLIANQLNMVPGTLVYNAADVHLYKNHIEQAKLQLTRTPKQLPQLKIKTPGKSIFEITIDDLELVGYDPHPAIKAEVAV